jgi:hypothetical protein
MSSPKSPGSDGAFLPNGHGMKPLSPPAVVYGINDSGQVVGQCRNSMLLQSYACAVSSNGAITALPESNPSIEGSGYQIQNATGINDTGQIIANATDTATANAQTRALLLNPV